MVFHVALFRFVALAGLKLREKTASASWVLGIKGVHNYTWVKRSLTLSSKGSFRS